MRVLRLGVVLALSFSLGSIASCTSAVAPPGYDLRVDWGLTDPTVDIPPGTDRFRILVWEDDADVPEESFNTVRTLHDLDDDGRREICPGSPDNDCTTSGLTPGAVIRITLEAQDTGGRTTHVGHVGPFILDPGERRHVDMRMYAANSVVGLAETPATGRFLHTATALRDGRVLIAGGFTRATTTTCPATAPAGAHCFDLTAASDAFVFHPPSGRTYEIAGGMLEARGGHTATLLPDDSVLVAGGADDAMLVLSPQGTGFVLDVVPSGGGDTYEIFAPYAPGEDDDADGDGDLAGGAFLGAADDVEVPGRLGTAHVLHGATLLPGGPSGSGARVLLAGGRSAPSAFTIFDLDRAGGYGVVGSGSLGAARVAPGAFTVGTGAAARAWIVGGGVAASNDDLAETWVAGTGGDRVGSTEIAEGFPDATSTSRPEFALLRPNVEIINGGMHALVLGWFGPQCAAASSTPIFGAGEYCGYDSAARRSYTVSATTGAAAPTESRNGHAFGATARLGDGRVVVTGGFDSLTLAARNTADLYTGTVTGGAAVLASERPPVGGSPRALHTTTALDDATFDMASGETVMLGGYVTFGGINVAADASAVMFVSGLEVVYLR